MKYTTSKKYAQGKSDMTLPDFVFSMSHATLTSKAQDCH